MVIGRLLEFLVAGPDAFFEFGRADALAVGEVNHGNAHVVYSGIDNAVAWADLSSNTPDEYYLLDENNTIDLSYGYSDYERWDSYYKDIEVKFLDFIGVVQRLLGNDDIRVFEGLDQGDALLEGDDRLGFVGGDQFIRVHSDDEDVAQLAGIFNHLEMIGMQHIKGAGGVDDAFTVYHGQKLMGEGQDGCDEGIGISIGEVAGV